MTQNICTGNTKFAGSEIKEKHSLFCLKMRKIKINLTICLSFILQWPMQAQAGVAILSESSRFLFLHDNGHRRTMERISV